MSDKNETADQQRARLDTISKTLDAIVAEHGDLLVAGAFQALALSRPEFALAMIQVAGIAHGVVRDRVAAECSCPACTAVRGKRAQA